MSSATAFSRNALPFMISTRTVILIQIGCCCASLASAFRTCPSRPTSAPRWIKTAVSVSRISERSAPPLCRHRAAPPTTVRACSWANATPQARQSLRRQGLQHQGWRQRRSRRNDFLCDASQENSEGENRSSGMPSSATEPQATGSSSSNATGSGDKEGKNKPNPGDEAKASPLVLATEEIMDGLQSLLTPNATEADIKATPAQPIEDSVALLVRDFRERVEELREQVGTTDAEGPVELKDVAQKFRNVLQGDPAAVEELRARVLARLEDVREEIEELLEIKELSKASDRLEKATAESAELVFESAVTAMTKGLDALINDGKDVIPVGQPTETLQVSTYIFGESNEFWDDLEANGVTPRRLFLYNLLGAGVVLGGNLFGVTSDLLGFAPESSRSARLDVLFPVQGFKRCYSAEDGYEFMYPQDWVGDTGLVLRRQRNLEDSLGSPSAVNRARRRRASTTPEVAFGPPGGDGKENVSVVKSQLMEGFSLRGTLGGPKEAAEKLLSTFLAPPDSGKQWSLLNAFEDTRDPGGLVYQFEYRVQGQGLRAPMHNVGVVSARGSTLFTVTVLAPETSWENGRGEMFQQMAKSFRLTF